MYITQSLDFGFEVVTPDAMFEMGIVSLVKRSAARPAGCPTFITFDMDFVDPVAAPLVETPEAGGTAREVLLLLRRLSGINLVGCDVTEITSPYDGPGQITSLLARKNGNSHVRHRQVMNYPEFFSLMRATHENQAFPLYCHGCYHDDLVVWRHRR